MIKNINVVASLDQSSPAGLNNVSADMIDQITNNFVEHIDCLCLDEFQLAERHKLFALMSRKLCLNGQLNIKIINPYLLANKILKSELIGEKLSTLIQSIKSMWSDHECQDSIKQANLYINNIYYDHIYNIYQLEKK